jgi:hypothetical protein
LKYNTTFLNVIVHFCGADSSSDRASAGVKALDEIRATCMGDTMHVHATIHNSSAFHSYAVEFTTISASLGRSVLWRTQPGLTDRSSDCDHAAPHCDSHDQSLAHN